MEGRRKFCERVWIELRQGRGSADEWGARVSATGKKGISGFGSARNEREEQLTGGDGGRVGCPRKVIRKANQEDVAAAKVAGTSGALLDRLELTEKRFREMVEGVRHVAELPDPVGEVIKSGIVRISCRFSKFASRSG